MVREGCCPRPQVQQGSPPGCPVSDLHSQGIIIHPGVLVGGTQTFIIKEAKYALGQPSSPSLWQCMASDLAPPFKHVQSTLWIKTQRCKQMRIEVNVPWQWDHFTMRSSLGPRERAVQKPCPVLGSFDIHGLGVCQWPSHSSSRSSLSGLSTQGNLDFLPSELPSFLKHLCILQNLYSF